MSRAKSSNIQVNPLSTLSTPLDTNANSVEWSKGADVASATELLLLQDGNYFDVTGTTTVTSIEDSANAWKVGSIAVLQFDGILTLTHHATNLILPSAANIVTAAGDIAFMQKVAAGDWKCVSYTRADGTALVSAGGGEFQIHTLIGFSDALTTTNWNGLNATYGGHEFNRNTGVDKTISISNLSSNGNEVFGFEKPIGMAIKNQTVVSCIFHLNYIVNITGFALVAVRQNTSNTFAKFSVLYENTSLSLDAQQYLTLDATDFSTTSIDAEDLIYAFVSSSDLNNSAAINIELKCSID